MNRSRSGYVYIVLCAVIFSTMEVMLKTCLLYTSDAADD